ncbi:CHAT domain-containing protein [Sphingopyxis sp. KK2]|uniref:CHAT domain-containing protein n=1 Tax=Sphingopyxis sp. KK2 TaxID=1855727 RepID=UPI001C4E2D02|nr:CHAT domain-containing protein [Sphingopyxis sp. KK2]
MGFSFRYSLLALALLFALPGAARAELAVAPLPPSPALAEALAAERFDQAMTLARREHEACMAANGFAACIGLLAAESDALTAWAEDHGDFDRDERGEGLALRTARRLHDEVGKLEGFDGPIFASAYGNLGEMLTIYGRPVEGEQHLRDGLRYNIVRAMDFTGTTRLSDAPLRNALLRLTRNLAVQGRTDEARGFLASADGLLSTLTLIGSPDAKPALPDYLAVAGLVPDAPIASDQPASFISADVGYEFELERNGEFWDPDQWDAVRGRLSRDYIAFLARTGQPAKAIARLDAEPDLLRGGSGSSALEFRSRIGAALVAEGRVEEGAAILDEAIPAVARTWDLTDDRRIDAHVARGAAILARDPAAGETAAADYRQAVAGATARVEATQTTEGLVLAVRRYRPAFEGFLGALSPDTASSTARADAFAAAQWSSIGETAATLAKVAAQTSRSSGPVAEKERFRQEVRDSVAALNRDIAQWLSVPGGDDQELLRKFYLRDVDAVMGDMSTEEIAAIDPAYDGLVKPRPLAADRVQALLGKGEALLFFLPDARGTSVFALTQRGFTWHRSALTRDALARDVDTLRAQLKRDIKERWVGSVDNFDEALAYRLYRELIAPIEPALGGATRLMTVTPGPLSGLPLTLLVTAPVPPEGEPAFLIDRYEVTTLPSVSSLFSIRCLLHAQAERPAACGDGPARARDASAPTLFAAGAPALKGFPGADRGVVEYSEIFDRGVASPARILEMSYLPGAQREIDGVRALFPGDTATALTGPAATEAVIKTSPNLKKARYVLFSTHGLLASETGLDGEPGLVFTPPAEGAQSELDDGLLTASEAAQLKLAADIVILSACNTASSAKGGDAEGLSGLAQSFFYAGAGALLVSHWPLDDASGAAIVTRLFAAIEQKPGASSSAFHNAVLALRRDPEASAPAFWAPLVYVGTTDPAP